MSIICSLIKKDYAILKSDTRGSVGDDPLPFPCPKGMQLEKDGKIILMTFCGELNFKGQNTFDHLKSEKEALFDIYENTNHFVALRMGKYLQEKYAQDIRMSAIKSLRIHIVTTKDFEIEPIICQVWLDFPKNVKRKDEATYLGFENGYRFWCAGGDDAQDAISIANADEILFGGDDFSEGNDRLDSKMKIAIDADKSCGYPVETFSFKYSGK